MSSLAELIEETKDARELKRALSVKMALNGMGATQVGELLHVTPQYVRKWTGRYETEGVGALRLGYRGSESYLSVEQRQEIEDWIGTHETVTVEEVRDYIEEHYGVVYQSKQSYYDLLEAGGMSYHRSEKGNPKRDESQVLARREEIKKNWRRTRTRLRRES
jgi:putative transposase